MSLVGKQVEAALAGYKDSAGNNLASGTLETFDAGTTNPRTVYKDKLKTLPYPNPLTLDESGRALIYADGLYKFEFKESDGTVLPTRDNLEYLVVEATGTVLSTITAADGNGVKVLDDSSNLGVFVKDGGNVGIKGDSDPSTALGVSDSDTTVYSSTLSVSANLSDIVRITNTNGSASYAGIITEVGNTAKGESRLITRKVSADNTHFYIQLKDSSTPSVTTEQLKLDSDGNLTIGASINVGNLGLSSNSLSSSSGNLNITPIAGSAAVIDSHFSFDGANLTAFTDNNTVITAYVGKNITIEGMAIDGGVVTGLSSITSTAFVGALTGQADTVATIAGLAPNTATTQASQPNITSLGILTGLEVSSSSIIGGTLVLKDNASTPGNGTIVNLDWEQQNSAGTNKRFCRIEGYVNDHTAGSEDGVMRFHSMVNGVEENAVNILGSGLGIGTDTPTGVLDSRGSSYFGGIGGGGVDIRDVGSTPGNGSINFINFSQESSNGSLNRFCKIDGYCNDDTAGSEAGSIHFYHRIGGVELRTMEMQGGTNGIKFNQYGAGTLSTDASGTVTASSDSYLKTDITDFSLGLQSVLKITPVRYKWNKRSGLDTENYYYGFTAQDLEQCLPEAVSYKENKDGGIVNGSRTVSDKVIIAALVNAVKELNKRMVLDNG